MTEGENTPNPEEEGKALFASLPPLDPKKHPRMTSNEVVKNIWGKTYLKLTLEAEKILAKHRLWLESGKPETPKKGQGKRANFSKCDLRWAYLWKAQLEEAILHQTHFEKAYLWGAYLKRAHLQKAHLQETNLWKAHFEEACLTEAYLQNANLTEAHLEETYLLQTHLEGASSYNAHLEGANLQMAHLEGITFWSAHLEGANLQEAHLEGADLRYAHLEGADLSEASFGPVARHVSWWDTDKKILVEQFRSFEPANFYETNLAGACLKSTRLEGVDLRTVKWTLDAKAKKRLEEETLPHLEKLSQRPPKKEFTDLREHLEQAQNRIKAALKNPHPLLQDTRLEGADLRTRDFGLDKHKLSSKKALYLDECLISNTRFDPEVNEPWHVLKREYSGYKFFLIFLITGLSFLPFAIETLAWKSYATGIKQLEKIGQTVEKKPQKIPKTAPKQEEYSPKRIQKAPEKQIDTRETQLIRHLLGERFHFWKKPSWRAFLTAISTALLAYTIMRALLTLRVSDFFRHEQGTGFSPAKCHRKKRDGEEREVKAESAWRGLLHLIPGLPFQSYQGLFLLHWYVLRWAFCISILLLILKFVMLAYTPLTLPTGETSWKEFFTCVAQGKPTE